MFLRLFLAYTWTLTRALQLETRLLQWCFYPGSLHKWVCLQSNQEGHHNPISNVRTCQLGSHNDVEENLYANLEPAMPMILFAWFFYGAFFVCVCLLFCFAGWQTVNGYISISLSLLHTHTRFTAPKNFSLAPPDSESQWSFVSSLHCKQNVGWKKRWSKRSKRSDTCVTLTGVVNGAMANVI